jgi:hypothetical protein
MQTKPEVLHRAERAALRRLRAQLKEQQRAEPKTQTSAPVAGKNSAA